MQKPNLFILGAPKCGTTTIASWLSQHPQVYFSPEKEPHHFYSPYGHCMDRKTYEALFEDAKPEHKVLAEASVWYLLSKNTTREILEYSPEAKFIICLRNPRDMAVSLHAQTLFIGRELITSFDEAWLLSDEREQGSFKGVFGFDQGDPKCMAYKTACLLGDQVEAVLKAVNRDRIFFLLLEDLQEKPQKTWNLMQDFLQIERVQGISFKPQNRAKQRKFIQLQRFTLLVQNLKRKFGIKKRFGFLAFFNRRNIVNQKYSKPGQDTLRSMREAFSADINKLSTLINRDLSTWLQ